MFDFFGQKNLLLAFCRMVGEGGREGGREGGGRCLSDLFSLITIRFYTNSLG